MSKRINTLICEKKNLSPKDFGHNKKKNVSALNKVTCIVA